MIDDEFPLFDESKEKLKRDEILEFNLCCVFTFPMVTVLSWVVTHNPIISIFVLLEYFIVMGLFETYIESKYKKIL